ncbi:MAG: MBL fold metallo-hydrolase [Acidimicrobiia bacterium]|nr:MBL fold metallo-hydrolase [Acidimicrobiia bacterium]
MLFTQYYLDCLSHASYLIGDETTGRAAVVDPQRDVSEYLKDAEEGGLTIEWVLETHFHADFLSGHLELAAATGARIGFGPGAQADFDVESLEDGRRIELGTVTLEILATPGHTPESISIVVYDNESAAPYGVLTGDTLFVGDVGRPDLLASVGVSADDLARRLYQSLHEKLLTLPDETRVFPAHGAGSACGKNLSTETQSTIGEQRRSNYALAPMSEDDFVEAVTQGQSVAPLYFSFAAGRNRAEHDLMAEAEPPPALSLDEVMTLQADGAVVLDTRDQRDFAAGHVSGSVNVGLGGRFAEYSGDVARPDQSIVVVGDPGTELEAKVRLGRIGFDRVVGYLDSPVRALLDTPECSVRSSRVTAAELTELLDSGAELQLVDVRNPGEVEAGIVAGAITIPLAELLDDPSELEPKLPTVVYCAGGYRSSVAASALAARGFSDVSDLVGGYQAWTG